MWCAYCTRLVEVVLTKQGRHKLPRLLQPQVCSIFFSFIFAFLCYPPLILIPTLKVLFSSSRNSLKSNLKVLLIKSWDGLFYETKSDILTGFAWLASLFVLVLNIFEIIPLCLSKCIGWSLYHSLLVWPNFCCTLSHILQGLPLG